MIELLKQLADEWDQEAHNLEVRSSFVDKAVITYRECAADLRELIEQHNTGE